MRITEKSHPILEKKNRNFRSNFIDTGRKMKRKRIHEEIDQDTSSISSCTIWFLLTSILSPKDISNIVFEYLTSFETRPSYLSALVFQENDDIIPTKSGWVFSVRRGNRKVLRTTFNDFEMEFEYLAFQFWDHTIDHDVIVLSRSRTKFDVRVWDVFNKVLLSHFTPFINQQYMIHLPMIRKILNWCISSPFFGGYLRLVDYSNRDLVSIQFSEHLYFLDIVIKPDSQLVSFLFADQLRHKESVQTEKFFVVNDRKIKLSGSPQKCQYWLDYPSWILRKEEQPLKVEDIGIYDRRFFSYCYNEKDWWKTYETGKNFHFVLDQSGELNLYVKTDHEETIERFSMNIGSLVPFHSSSNGRKLKLRLFGGTRRDFVVSCESHPSLSYIREERRTYLFFPKCNQNPSR